MADLEVKQNIDIRVARKPATPGLPIGEVDFEKKQNLKLDEFNENYGFRFSVPDATVDQSLGMGTVTSGKMLIMCPENDIKVKLVFTGPVQTPDIVFKAGKMSVLHTENLIDVLLSNDSGVDAKGKFFVVGD